MTHVKKILIVLALCLMLTSHSITATCPKDAIMPYAQGTMTPTENSVIYQCKNGLANFGGPISVSTCQDGSWSPVNLKCSDFSNCTAVVNGRHVYGGKVHQTVSGRECQRWDSQTPHGHSGSSRDRHFRWTNGIAPEKMRDAANYCRDPDHSNFLWCYTMDRNRRWERCAIPSC